MKEVVLDERSTDKFVYFIHIPMCYSFIVFNYGQILAYSPNVVPPGHSNCGVDVGCTWNGMHGWPAKMFSEEVPWQIVLGDSRLLRMIPTSLSHHQCRLNNYLRELIL